MPAKINFRVWEKTSFSSSDGSYSEQDKFTSIPSNIAPIYILEAGRTGSVLATQDVFISYPDPLRSVARARTIRMIAAVSVEG